MASPQFSRKFHVGEAILAFAVLGLLSSTAVECRGVKPHRSNQVSDHQAINCRKHSFDLSKFGGKGDGVTLNTAAFKTAIAEAGKVAADGGALLIVPPGKWLTGSFNLTSHFTLYIHKEAVILASQEERDYQLIAPLPSYGVGRDAPGPRFSSLIMGTNLTDVVITGGNGTIDGQGEPWWTKFKAGQLNNTRPYLIEILYSDQVQISNITLTNSPSWHVHPTYSSNVIIEGVTILAPVFVPNTDGINPDSCTNVRIQNCFIVSGDDCIAVKSGWDQYGIRFAKPMQHLVVRKLTCISPKSAVIALGSEMSGGIEDVRIEDITAISSESGIRIKTAPGRGGYVRDIYARRLTMQTMKYVFWMTGAYGSHPDAGWNPKANPVIQSINYRDVVATNVTMAGQLAGMEGNPFTGICMQNVSIHLTEVPKKVQWNCTDIQGTSSAISPMACGLLEEKKGTECAFPKEPLPIEGVVLKTCPTSFA